MGIRQSAIRLPAPSPNVPVFALTFRKPDTITLVLAGSGVATLITNVCNESWTKGFEFIGRQSDDSYQLVFKGNPFLIGERREYAEAIKRLCCRLLSELYALGYECVLASDLSRYPDYTTWFFEQHAPAVDHAPIICLSLSSTDCLQLFNGNQLLKTALRNAVIESYGPGIEDERTFDDNETDYYELKLCGSPWYTTVFDLSIWARKVILAIFEAFYRCNYRYYTSANLKGTADSIFFIYDETIDTTFASRRPSMMPSLYADDDVKFCLVSLNGNNRLRLLYSPRDMIEATAKTISTHWPYGFKRQLDVAEGIVREFEMGGTPWWTSNQDSIASRAFLAQLFETYLELGWRIVCSLDISRRVNDKSVFILQSRSPSSMHHFCISFNDTDKVRIIRARPKVAVMIEKIIVGNWPRGIKREIDYYNSREIKLKGTPFEPVTPNEASMLRVLMCYLLNRLHHTGCRVIASSDVSAKFHHKGSSGPNFPFDVHSWFVVSRN